VLRVLAVTGVLMLSCLTMAQSRSSPLKGQGPPFAEISSSEIPRLEKPPKLADFEGMEPVTELARKMLKIDKFLQREPHDGIPSSQRTEAYLGYTDKNFYALFLAFDTEPAKIRARMLRRELIDDDDQVGLFLDTFHDRRHAYYFYANAYGIQQDGLFAESGGPDNSFDTVWQTDAHLTGNGYMVLFEIPFKSLRFRQSDSTASKASTASTSWGIFLARVIPRNAERSFYPLNTQRLQGWLSQEGTLDGFRDISPGKNMQFIPYASLGAFRSLDDRDPAGERFTGKHLEPKVGLDSKVVIKDSLVLDATINPDFGQIESDDPQTTVNQRFEVFFPEKRPFFQENANYFQTPFNLVFTRRVIDPLYGLRLTGKTGPWAIGAFVADDKAPEKSVLKSDPLSGNDAYFGVLRLNREIGKDNTVGFIYTDRELHTSPNSFCTATFCEAGFNRVGGVDAHIKIDQNWQVNAQAITSETKLNDGTHEAGPAYQIALERTSRKIELNTTYQDISPGFNTDTGFVPRTDFRQVANSFNYNFFPEGKVLISHGFHIFDQTMWDHNGTRLDYVANPNYSFTLPRQTNLGWFGMLEHERLRPSDFSALAQNRDYAHYLTGPFVNTQFLKWISLNGELDMGTATNFVPRTGPPTLAKYMAINAKATVRPVSGLTIENTYLLNRYLDNGTGIGIFNNHIVRSKWNYQFTKEFSLRVIGQYTATLSNPALTTLQNAKNFNGDVLFTYLVNPGTAVYVGYNSNLQNLDPSLARIPDGLLRTRNSFINDGRQFFVKLSYLFRY